MLPEQPAASTHWTVPAAEDGTLAGHVLPPLSPLPPPESLGVVPPSPPPLLVPPSGFVDVPLLEDEDDDDESASSPPHPTITADKPRSVPKNASGFTQRA